MPQRTLERSNVRNAPSAGQKKQEPPIVAPDDPFPVKEQGTGKPGQAAEVKDLNECSTRHTPCNIASDR
jgi:hypothetical protein